MRTSSQCCSSPRVATTAGRRHRGRRRWRRGRCAARHLVRRSVSATAPGSASSLPPEPMQPVNLMGGTMLLDTDHSPLCTPANLTTLCVLAGTTSRSTRIVVSGSRLLVIVATDVDGEGRWQLDVASHHDHRGPASDPTACLTGVAPDPNKGGGGAGAATTGGGNGGNGRARASADCRSGEQRDRAARRLRGLRRRRRRQSRWPRSRRRRGLSVRRGIDPDRWSDQRVGRRWIRRRVRTGRRRRRRLRRIDRVRHPELPLEPRAALLALRHDAVRAPHRRGARRLRLPTGGR